MWDTTYSQNFLNIGTNLRAKISFNPLITENNATSLRLKNAANL